MSILGVCSIYSVWVNGVNGVSSLSTAWIMFEFPFQKRIRAAAHSDSLFVLLCVFAPAGPNKKERSSMTPNILLPVYIYTYILNIYIHIIYIYIYGCEF